MNQTKVRDFGKAVRNGDHTPIEELDGIIVNDTAFVSVDLTDRMTDIAEYLMNREARHKASLAQQGIEVSKWRKAYRNALSLIEAHERTMNMQDKAILYWNHQYDSLKMKSHTAMSFAVGSIVLAAFLAGYVYFRGTGCRVPFIDGDTSTAVSTSSTTPIQSY